VSGHTEAWQWLGGDLKQGDPDWVAEATEPGSSMLEQMVLTGGLNVWTARGKQKAHTRDWIVRIDGEIFLFSESAWSALSDSHAELVRALEAIEFRGHQGKCPLCAGWNMSPSGETPGKHTKDCLVGTALAKLPPAKGET